LSDAATIEHTVYITDNADAGTKTIEVTAELADGTSETVSFDIVIDPCTIVTVGQTNQYYIVFSGTTTFGITPFTMTGALCPQPTYSAVEDGSVVLPTWLAFNAGTTTFTLDSALNS